MKSYMGRWRTMAMILHKLPIMNSPRTNPEKKGVAFLCALSPPRLRITHLIAQLIKNDSQKMFIV